MISYDIDWTDPTEETNWLGRSVLECEIDGTGTTDETNWLG